MFAYFDCIFMLKDFFALKELEQQVICKIIFPPAIYEGKEFDEFGK